MALCAVVSLAACGDDPVPRTLPPVPSASPLPAVVPMPSEAAAETPQGAAAFARYWFDLVNRAFAHGDSAELRLYSHPGCDGCNNLINAAEEETSPQERIEGGVFSVVFAEAPPVEAGDVMVDLRYALSELRVRATDGRVLRTTPGNPGIDAQLRLVREGSGWIVRGFRNVDE